MKLKSGAGGELNGFLDAGSHMKGELHFEDTFRIDGHLTGTVLSDGDLIIGAGGEIAGDIKVGRAFISGTVRGSVEGRKRVEITAQGRVFADVETPALVVEDGALFQGRCTMSGHAKAAQAAAAAPPSPGPKPVPIARDR